MSEKKVVLYDLCQELKALDELLIMEKGECSEEYEALEKEVIESLSLKVDGYIGYTSSLSDEIVAAKRRITELKTFVSVRENSIERLKGYALSALEASGKDKFVGEFGEISTRKPVKVLEIRPGSENNIPLEFISSNMVTSIDKASLKKYLKSGEKIEGCSLVDGKKSIQFKNKSL